MCDSGGGGAQDLLGGGGEDYNVLFYLTSDTEVVFAYHLLVCVHIQELEGVSRRKLSGHVDPPALHLYLF